MTSLSGTLMLTVGNYGALSKHQSELSRKQALTCLYHQHHHINTQDSKDVRVKHSLFHICLIDIEYRILILKKKYEYEGEHKS